LIVSLGTVDVGWLGEPIIAAEIEYRAWRGDYRLGHALFKGIRDAADEIAIYSVEA
jgi:bifunctional non-homologous end joining protein LigD